jgi:yecA family protein
MAHRDITWDYADRWQYPATNLESANGAMTNTVDQHELDAALQRCGSSWTASQAHGLVCSRLALCGAEALDDWLALVLEDSDPGNALQQECAAQLRQLHEDTHRQLAERGSEFNLLLPNEGESAAVRTEAMAQWCEGFLNGLVLRVQGDLLKKRLSGEPLNDIIRDMLEITLADVDEDADDESTEVAFTEVQEYLRAAVQLVYEELAEFRQPPATRNRTSNQVH